MLPARKINVNANNTPETFRTKIPRLSHAEIQRIVRDAERMRAEHMSGLLRSAARGIARLARAAVKPQAIHRNTVAHVPFRPLPRYS